MLLYSLQVRLVAILVLGVGVALGTVAVVAHWSTLLEFQRYVTHNRAQMEVVAQQIAASTGDRLVVADPKGQVILDSSGELLGQTVSVPPPGLASAAAGAPTAIFIRSVRDPGDGMQGVAVGAQDVLWYRDAPAPDADAQPGPVERALLLAAPPLLAPLPAAGIAGPAAMYEPEQRFFSSVDRSLLGGVVVGGGAAVAVGLA